MRRYANKIDSNQAEIVKALRKIYGVSVYIIAGTIDLIVGYMGRNYLIEIKTPKGSIRDSQVKFIQEWTGQVNICRSLDDVLLIIGVTK